MLIKRLKISGLLSFGPTGLDLPLGNLNILIGPNGSGKSNLLDVLMLLRAAPTNLATPIKKHGGIWEWLWKGKIAIDEATLEAFVTAPDGPQPIQHSITIANHGGRVEVVNELIQRSIDIDLLDNTSIDAEPEQYGVFYAFDRGRPVLYDRENRIRRLQRENLKPEESILSSQYRDPERYPVLSLLRERYEQIRSFRNWFFGPDAPLRHAQSTQMSADFLVDGGDNLALVLSKILPGAKVALREALTKLYEDIEDVNITIEMGNAQLFLQEGGGKPIPATRLSDGTLRYLCLLAILLHPEPPPLVVLEEPELGLHPDIIPHVAELLMRASERTQLVVTTHSRMLVDALSVDPSSVIVCDKVNGESRFERLDPMTLSLWLEKYSLGELWSMGELGGNRW